MAINLMKRMKFFAKDDCGATMVEYGVALLVVTAIGTTLMTSLGDEVEENVQAACDSIAGSTASTDCI